MSKIADFREKDIRAAIIRKAPIERINKNSKHWKADLAVNGKLVAKVKIPNDHDRIMHASKSQYIAYDLKLDDEQFNQFVKCTFSADQYTELLKSLL